MMSELKPCPFCGGEGCLQEHIFVGYTNTYGVVCLDCCAETRQFFRTREEAIEAWNRRTDADMTSIEDSARMRGFEEGYLQGVKDGRNDK